jgi:transcriptional regulator with XRE-family HTH domain
MLDKSANTVSLWCTNKIQPSVDDLYRIAKILDCKVSDLLLEEDEIEFLNRDKN